MHLIYTWHYLITFIYCLVVDNHMLIIDQRYYAISHLRVRL